MASIKRGDVVVCALAGDYGKPRPAVIVQSNLFNPTHASIVVCPITSHIVNAPLFRINIPPCADNGLVKTSQVMVDKITAMRSDRIQHYIGYVSAKQLLEIDQALKICLEI